MECEPAAEALGAAQNRPLIGAQAAQLSEAEGLSSNHSGLHVEQACAAGPAPLLGGDMAPPSRGLPKLPHKQTVGADAGVPAPGLPGAAGAGMPLVASFGAPLTPTTSNPPAATTPPPASAEDCAATAAAAPTAPSATAEAAAAAAKVAAAAAVWRRLQGFMQRMLSSPVVMSALLLLEAEGGHPPAEDIGCAGLRWTLAQMLALYLKAGYTEASEAQVLVLLWTLEGWADVWRSSCTTVLHSYLKHLATIDSERALAMSLDWPAQFRGMRCEMSAAQLDLLKRLGWRVRLDFVKEVAPSYSLLFSPPSAPATPRHSAEPSEPAGTTSPPAATLPGPLPGAPAPLRSVREAWVQRMECMCAGIAQKAAAMAAHAAVQLAGESGEAAEEEEAEPFTPAPPKRQRLY